MEELKFNIEPIENAFDFALSALEYISNKHDKSALKYAILHLSSGMEIILKEPLRRKHWAFIFEDVNKANYSNYKSGDFQSVKFDTCIKRLENICNIFLSEDKRKILKIFRDKRNKLEHYALSESRESLISSTSKALSILLEFINLHLDPDSFSTSDEDIYNKIKKGLKDFDQFVSDRLGEINSKLQEISKESKIIECPFCFQDTMVLDDPPTCLFCYHTDDPETIAKEYIESILGISYYMCVKDGSDYPLHECPNCMNETLVDFGSGGSQFEEDQYVCFSCGEVWKENSFTSCSRCGKLILGDGSEICDDCSKTIFNNDN